MINYTIIKQEVLQEAMDTWGYTSQMEMLVEECAELILAIKHFDRNRVGYEVIASEIADVLIMINQIATVTGYELINVAMKYKMDRLESRLEHRKRALSEGVQNDIADATGWTNENK